MFFSRIGLGMCEGVGGNGDSNGDLWHQWEEIKTRFCMNGEETMRGNVMHPMFKKPSSSSNGAITVVQGVMYVLYSM